MSVYLKPGQLKIKDENGDYTGINTVALESTAEYLEEMETKGDQIIDDIETKGEETLESIPDDYTALSEEVDELNERLDNLQPGLSDNAKTALLACFAKVAWDNADGDDYIDALRTALYESTSPYIRAVFTQGSTAFFTDDDLSELKDNLVVTYFDGESSTVLSPSAYTLSGTLTVGSNTITVLYGSYRAEFSVNVIENIAPALANMNYPNYGDGSIVYENGVLSMKCISDTEVSSWYIWAAGAKGPKWNDVLGKDLIFRIKLRNRNASASGGVHWYPSIFKDENVTSMGAASRKSAAKFAELATTTEYQKHQGSILADLTRFNGSGSLTPDSNSTVGALIYVVIKDTIDISQLKMGAVS